MFGCLYLCAWCWHTVVSSTVFFVGKNKNLVVPLLSSCNCDRNIHIFLYYFFVQEFEYLWPKLDLLVDGGVLNDTDKARLGSTVVDLSQEGKFRIIREGRSVLKTNFVCLLSF